MTGGVGPRTQRQILLLGVIALTVEILGVLLGFSMAGVCLLGGWWWQLAVWLALGIWCLREVILFGGFLNRHGPLWGVVTWAFHQENRMRRVRGWFGR